MTPGYDRPRFLDVAKRAQAITDCRLGPVPPRVSIPLMSQLRMPILRAVTVRLRFDHDGAPR